MGGAAAVEAAAVPMAAAIVRASAVGGGRGGARRAAARATARFAREDPPPRPVRPARIVLIRHGESLGNVDESVYQTTPDNRVPLTARGREQARAAGEKLREIAGEDGLYYFYVSPYTRTEETMFEVCKALDVNRITGVREEPRIREQDFGNLQSDGSDGGAPMGLLKRQRLAFGRFFFRFPDGESAADVYDRVTGFRDTLLADINMGRFAPGTADEDGEGKGEHTVVVVTHGISLRVFLMRWYKMYVNQFEMLPNPRNCELVVMERGEGGRYSLMPFHGEEELRRMGFDDAMIAEQSWHARGDVKELNPKAAESARAWLDNVERKLAAQRD